LLAKIDIAIKFILGISKFLNDIMGQTDHETTYLEFVKSMVEPVIGASCLALE
jgi:hypothetical protein